ncbi:Mu transposase C-terminal domain-containing protein [Salinarimonas rosea]|uniref:Mu transposase C-terminal domain-containing protein n=1 Tax=Salinarimonas rosea TaxID=552063 RepID=UPI00040A60E6|nr:Mu transposase C-terminal domain-containing protein [Salinarimonas rosea]
MIIPAVRDVVRFADSGRRERLIWVEAPRAAYFFIDIDAESTSPLLRRREEIEALIGDGLLAPTEDPWLRPMLESALSPAQKAKRDAAWSAIQPLIADQPMVFDPEYRSNSVARIVAASALSRQTVYRLIRRYWQRGMTPNALIPDYANSGAPGQDRPTPIGKRGRAVKFGLEGLNVDRALRDKMRDAVTRYYGMNRRIDLKECHKLLLDDHFTDMVVDPKTGAQKPMVRQPYPSMGQFRYWFEKDNDVFEIERRRRTPRVFDKDMRALLSTSTASVPGPGSLWQIDATIADVYLVSRLNRSKIIGRPVLYFITDVFSRMIVGLAVTFEGPSWVGAMTALVNAASDKVAFCREYGIEIEPADWPCVGLPSAIIGDRGEMLSPRAETLINHFGVDLKNTPPYRADLKGIVEKRFDLIQKDFGPYVPGFVEPDFRERGVRDYRLDSKLTIDEFISVIINCVLVHNNSHRFKEYPRDAQMIADDVQPVPIDLWEWGIARRGGDLQRYSAEKVRLSLLPEDVATVTRSGIRFYDCYYSSSEAVARNWFVKANGGRWKVPISYDPRCMDTIWLHGDARRPTFTPCFLTDRSAMYRDRSLWEVDQIRQAEKRADARHEATRLSAEIDRDRRNREIVKKATAATDAVLDPEATAASRTKGIRANRAAERAAHGKEQAVRHAEPSVQGDEARKVVPFDRGAGADSSGVYDEPSVADFEDFLLKDDGDER